jgi:acyl-coenzyme A thioesterase PaaI-like protein
VTVTCGFDERLTQQHGLLHGGLLASLVDVACGYAALSVMPADRTSQRDGVSRNEPL